MAEAAMAVLILSLLLGIAFGLRFNVLVLVPAITVVGLFSSVVAVIGNDRWSAVLAFVELSTAMQFGYLVGAAAAEPVARGLQKHTQIPGPAHRMR
jgi:uncharacterized membrane protein YjjB (DUF3815 family)